MWYVVLTADTQGEKYISPELTFNIFVGIGAPQISIT